MKLSEQMEAAVKEYDLDNGEASDAMVLAWANHTRELEAKLELLDEMGAALEEAERKLDMISVVACSMHGTHGSRILAIIGGDV